MNVLPIAGKTGTAQGAGSYPWNDSSAFARIQPRQRHSPTPLSPTSRRAASAPRRRRRS